MDQASRALRLVDRGQFKSIRQVSRATDVARSTVQDRRAGRQPCGQEEVKHARLRRYQEEVLAKYIQNTQLQYAPVNREQLHVVAEMKIVVDLVNSGWSSGRKPIYLQHKSLKQCVFHN
jgi:hypothetical protein